MIIKCLIGHHSPETLASAFSVLKLALISDVQSSLVRGHMWSEFMADNHLSYLGPLHVHKNDILLSLSDSIYRPLYLKNQPAPKEFSDGFR